MNEELITEIYQQLCIDSDENFICAALADKYADANFDACFKKAYARFLKQTAPGYPAKYHQTLAGYALIAARSFHVCDYKTAKSALDSKVKLLQILEAKDNFKKAPAKKLGRESTYTKEKADKICALIECTGVSLEDAATSLGIPFSTAYGWSKNKPDFSEALSRARKNLANVLKENALNLLTQLQKNSEKATSPEEKARCLDQYRRFLEFMLTKNCPEYREKATLEMTGKDGSPLHHAATPEQLEAMAQHIAAARQRIIDQAREKGRTIQE